MNNSYKSFNSGFKFFSFSITTVIVLVILAVISLIITGLNMGMAPFGPQNEVTATVQRTYVDISSSNDGSSESHYMVGTDNGVFEVDNSIILGIYNADEIYSKMVPGKKYVLTTKGNKVVNIFFQSYPYIIAVKEVK